LSASTSTSARSVVAFDRDRLAAGDHNDRVVGRSGAHVERIAGALGEDGKGLSKIRVILHETDLARAWFEGPVG
jgi:hypothetical protein